jgi:hypothetical protein
LRAGVANKEISKELQYIVDRLKLATYDSPIHDPEFDDIVHSVATVKKITTAGMLAFRPVILAKELSIGLYRAMTLASAKLYGKNQFGYKSVFKALSKMMTIDKKFTLD